jgi:hypothetical protein
VLESSTAFKKEKENFVPKYSMGKRASLQVGPIQNLKIRNEPKLCSDSLNDYNMLYYPVSMSLRKIQSNI